MCYADFTTHSPYHLTKSTANSHGATAAMVHWLTVLTGTHLHLVGVYLMWNKFPAEENSGGQRGGLNPGPRDL